MYFVIKGQKLKKLKNIISIFNEHSISFQKIENLNIKCSKNFLYCYINNSFLNFQLLLEKNDELIIFKEGNISIDLKIFYLYLENLKENNILELFKIEKNLLKLSSKNFTCNLIIFNTKIKDLEDFDLEKALKLIFSYELLKTIYFKFKDSCKQLNNIFHQETILSTINIKKYKNNSFIEVLSSDSYKTSFGNYEVNSDFKTYELDINIFPQIISILIALFSYNKENIEIYFYKDFFLIKNNEILIKSKLFEGNYPNLKKWFNLNINIEFLINKNSILNAIDRSLLLSNKNLKIVFYRLENEKLWIEYKNDEKGFSIEHIEIKNLKNKNINFSLNNYLLKQLIKNIDSEEIIFRISESLKPIIIFGKNNSENFKQFILPLKNY